MFRPTIRQIFALILLIAGLHFLGLERHYYWLLWWYDIVLHLLGGLWVGLVAIWLGRQLNLTLGWSRLLLIILTVGVAWELYELWFGLTLTSKAGYLEDTGLDLVFDLLGAIGAGFFSSPPFPFRHPSVRRADEPRHPLSSPPAHH